MLSRQDIRNVGASINNTQPRITDVGATLAVALPDEEKDGRHQESGVHLDNINPLIHSAVLREFVPLDKGDRPNAQHEVRGLESGSDNYREMPNTKMRTKDTQPCITDVGATLAVALQDMLNTEMPMKDTQPCILNAGMPMKDTQSSITNTRACIKDTEVCIKNPHVCIKDAQPCMPNTRVGIRNTRIGIKYPR